jgi:hypothetical protein
MNPIAIYFVGICVLLILTLPKKYFIVPFLVGATFITLDQKVVIWGLDFTVMRVMLLFCFIRVVVRGEVKALKFNKIDRVLIYYVLASIVTYWLLWQTGDALITKMGFAYTVLGIYFIFRIYIQGINEIKLVLLWSFYITIALALFMLNEKFTARNIFYIFGGVPEYTYVRNGELRCQGPFLHSIMAGTFGATNFPLMVGYYKYFKEKTIILKLALISSVVVTFTASSSGAELTLMSSVLGLLMWKYRSKVQYIKWIMPLSILFLQVFMTAPVWFIIARLSGVVGGTGFHRARLIDQTIKHFWEWWLIGTKTTADWGFNLYDITNHYILIGVRGGIVSLVLFIWIFVLCFKSIGLLVADESSITVQLKILIWSFAVALFAHLVAFVGVSYFDQIIIYFYLLLAIISFLSVHSFKLDVA